MDTYLTNTIFIVILVQKATEMSLKDINNPATIKFLVESYNKENRLRCNWILNNKEELLDAATLHREPTNYFETDVIAHVMVDGMATISRDHVVAGYNRRKVPIRDAVTVPGVKHLRHGHSIADIGLGDPKIDPRLKRPDEDLSFDPVMRPVNPKIRKIIYKPKPEFGREIYLEKRTKVWPEEKYYFPECVNWDYGWRNADSKLKQKPEYGRCWRLARALKTRVGPQPDPPYYTSADIPNSTKCVPY